MGCDDAEDDDAEDEHGTTDSVESLPEEIELCKDEGAILCFGTASGSNGKIPHFKKPDLIFGIENALSSGPLITRENSRLDTTKFFLEKARALTPFAYWS